MSAVQMPQEKKRLAYERDHYAKGKSDKAFRKGWPKKKRKASRSFRHAAEALTKAASLDTESDAKISAIRKRRLRKWDVPTLRDRVAQKLARRVRTIGAKKVRGRERQSDRSYMEVYYSLHPIDKDSATRLALAFLAKIDTKRRYLAAVRSFVETYSSWIFDFYVPQWREFRRENLSFGTRISVDKRTGKTRHYAHLQDQKST